MVQIIDVSTHGDFLHTPAKEVPAEFFGTQKLKNIIDNMFHALAKEKHGVALAAVQIGEPLQIFVVAPHVLQELNDPGDLVYINPRIIKHSKKQELKDEGCLSVKGRYGRVKRFQQVTLTYQDQSGTQKTRGAGGFLAHIFQHEVDHLNGILYIDRAEEVFAVDEDLRPVDEASSV